MVKRVDREGEDEGQEIFWLPRDLFRAQAASASLTLEVQACRPAGKKVWLGARSEKQK